jgi:hypothetical protein
MNTVLKYEGRAVRTSYTRPLGSAWSSIPRATSLLYSPIVGLASRQASACSDKTLCHDVILTAGCSQLPLAISSSSNDCVYKPLPRTYFREVATKWHSLGSKCRSGEASVTAMLKALPGQREFRSKEGQRSAVRPRSPSP